MEPRLKRGRGGEDGWLATVSGAEEQTAGQIEFNAARHQVFDVQVLPLVFLLGLRDLRAENSHHML